MMKKRACAASLRWGFACVLLVCVLAALGSGLAAENQDDFCLCYGGEQLYISKRSDHYYLFVPGSWAGDAITVGTENGVLIDGVAYQHQDAAPPLEDGARWSIRMGGDEAVTRKVIIRVGSPLPALFLHTESGSLAFVHKDKENREPGQYCLFTPEQEPLTGGLEYMRMRGNTTLKQPKKPYMIKLDQKQSLLGMNRAKKWVLLADHLDVSLLRNRITLDLVRAAGVRYAVDCRHVDLYINGEYRGLYLLCEKIEISDQSVAITDQQDAYEVLNPGEVTDHSMQLFSKKNGDEVGGFSVYRAYTGMNNPADITGGYLLECDKKHRFYEDKYVGFITGNGTTVEVKEPECASVEMVTYIGEQMNAFHRAILTNDGVDPVTGAAWDELMDAESLAHKYLIEEFTLNFDAMDGSQYFYKDVDAVSTKIYAGPAWDYDLTFGNVRHNPLRMYLRSMEDGHREFWYPHLHRFDSFEQLLGQLWRDTYSPLIRSLLEPTEGSPLRPITAYAEEISASAAMNTLRWGKGTVKGRDSAIGNSFSSGVDYLLYYVETRLKYIDKHFALGED